MNLIFSISFLVLVVAVIVNLFFVYLVYRSDPKSATNRIFSLLVIFLSIWLGMIYMAPNPHFALFGLVLARLTLFFITPVNMLFFLLGDTFPDRTLHMPRKWFTALFSLTAFIMLLSVSPYAFTGARMINDTQIITVGPGFILFGIFSVLLDLGAVILFVRKLQRATGEERRRVGLAVTGIAVMFDLVIFTIFLPVIIYNSTVFVPFAPLYVLVFIGTTGYAIVKYHLFNLKVSAVKALTVAFLIIPFARMLIDQSLSDRVVDAIIFSGTALFGILLMKSVEKEIRQREQLQILDEKLETKNKQLEELSRFKSELLSLVSHQIRSPLAAIKGFLALIMKGSYGAIKPALKEPLAAMKQSADDLLALIDTLLDMRRVDEGKIEYRFETVDLAELVAQVIGAMAPLAEEKKLVLSFPFQKNPVFVSADRENLKQVIRNLVDNAIKYTPAGFIRVALEESADHATVSVADSGLGISSAMIPYVFEEFIRDERVKKKIRGTGLGLYIARKIVEAHSGKIWAVSDGEEKGSVFFVSLPKVKIS